MPRSLVLALGAGIGLFTTFVGLTSNGLNVVCGRNSRSTFNMYAFLYLISSYVISHM
ncbi:hypothetical protein M378DRAFT_173475 [Amanita muscaria Koide BX008]|uniref:Uncharacterized protein n=1 Tax=Amanita muscaria (strain Koide BX008) TaxID=946122 RepID=A0A0C2WHM8_AMAMK|nr:hypothetical protein M378DRAFT_173475 [Amanita muscaria Koide BX008]